LAVNGIDKTLSVKTYSYVSQAPTPVNEALLLLLLFLLGVQLSIWWRNFTGINLRGGEVWANVFEKKLHCQQTVFF